MCDAELIDQDRRCAAIRSRTTPLGTVLGPGGVDRPRDGETPRARRHPNVEDLEKEKYDEDLVFARCSDGSGGRRGPDRLCWKL
ncbi:MAG TPA: hypothetical protein VFT22_28020 [Kofleriaceae bacterium]|nr:hypothetical protein [Kofleriaceae bacterium]